MRNSIATATDPPVAPVAPDLLAGVPALDPFAAQIPVPGLEMLALVAGFALLVAGVVGSVVPSAPGAPLSTAGVLVYWWGTDFSEPGLGLLVGLVAVGLLTWVVDFAGGAISARIGGAATSTAVVAGLVGLIMLVVSGPLGTLLGVVATVFLLEFRRQQDARAGAKAALVTTAGMLGSVVAQALLTGSMLVVMLTVALT